MFLIIIYLFIYLLSFWNNCETDVQAVSRNSSIVFSIRNLLSFSDRLGLAYAGSNRQDVLSLILRVLSDSKSNLEVIRYAVTLNFVSIGTHCSL